MEKVKKIIIYLILCFLVGVLFGIFTHQANASSLEDKIIYDAMIDVRVFNQFSINTLKPDEMMDFAYKTGKEENLGETLRAIVFLESNFGKIGRIGDDGVARGVTQIQIPTAHFILKKLMNIKYRFSDNQIKKLITYNDKVAIIMSKYYLVYLMKIKLSDIKRTSKDFPHWSCFTLPIGSANR